MLISKPVSSELERKPDGFQFRRVCEGQNLSRSFDDVNPVQGLVVEACSEGLFFVADVESFNHEENLYWRLLTCNKRPNQKVYHSANFLDLMIMKHFRTIRDLFGLPVKITIGDPSLRAEVRLSKNCKVVVTADGAPLEFFNRDIAVYKVYGDDRVIYYLPKTTRWIDSMLEKGALIMPSMDELSWLLPVFERERVMVQFHPREPALMSFEPTIRFLFNKLKIDRNFLYVGGQLNFDYPKSSRNRLYLRSIETESQITHDILSLGFSVDGGNISCSNDVAITLVCGNGDVLLTSESIKARQPKIEFSDEFFHSNIIRRLCFEASLLDDRVVLKANLDNEEFKLLVESCQTELFEKRNWISLRDRIILLPFDSLRSLRVFLEYFEFAPDYKNVSLMSADLSEIQLLSFWSFATKIEGFSLRGFEKVAEKFQRIINFKRINLVDNYKFLRDYQEEGVSWLLHLFENDLGGLLADEMGLGKTVQALVLVDKLVKERRIRRALVVAPTSVVYNWHRECAKFCPDVSVLVFHGAKRRDELSNLRSVDLIITSYAILRLDQHIFRDLEVDVVFLDEAQLIKNSDSVTYRCVREIPSRVRFALTGTPVENRASELWSIFNFLLPKGLGTKLLFSRLVEKSQSENVVEKLGQSLKPFILRREKVETLRSLPPKVETTEMCEMTELQRQLYDAYRDYALKAIKEYKTGKTGYTHVFTAIMRLRQICNHPSSFINSEEARVAGSGKLERFKEIVDELAKNGRKFVVFCQFLEMINIIELTLQSMGVKTFKLTGGTKDRLSVIDAFASAAENSSLVMSLKAGGLGLNLTMASDVILYDPWWNPQVENQAIDRLHRIGQTNTVFVYRLVTVDSIESRMEDIKQSKRDLFIRLLSSKQTKIDVNFLASLI